MPGDRMSAAESYLDWWTLAGVDQGYLDAPVDFLVQTTAKPAVPEPIVPEPIVAEQTHRVASLVREIASERPISPPHVDLPDSFDGLRQWIATSPDLPGAHWSHQRVVPTGTEAARLLVVGFMPDPIDLSAGQLLSGEAGALFDRMLAAIDLSRSEIGLTSISYTCLATGRIPPADCDALVAIMRRYVAVARPRLVLVLGDKACQPLLGQNLRSAEGQLLEFNHDRGSCPALATFAPRALIENPSFKRAAWESLQIVQRELKT